MTSARFGTLNQKASIRLPRGGQTSSRESLLQKLIGAKAKNSAKNPGSKQKQDDPIGSVTVTATSLNVRNGAGTNYERIGGLTKGKSVQYYEEKDGWLRINYGTETGWIKAEFTDYQPPEPQFESFQARVTTNLNMRTGPSTDYEIITTLNTGTIVTVINESNGWYQVQYGDQIGWMSGQYLAKYDPSAVSAAGQKAADYAYTLMNTCVSNGWTYNQDLREVDGYYDCSSFTCRCWAHAGLDLGWANSESQAIMIYNAGGEVSASDVQPGDLLFYHSNWSSGERWRGVNHVAIAVGGGKRVDAGDTPVREVNSIDSPVMVGRPTVLM